jgi:hypothetical protein
VKTRYMSHNVPKIIMYRVILSNIQSTELLSEVASSYRKSDGKQPRTVLAKEKPIVKSEAKRSEKVVCAQP